LLDERPAIELVNAVAQRNPLEFPAAQRIERRYRCASLFRFERQKSTGRADIEQRLASNRIVANVLIEDAANIPGTFNRIAFGIRHGVIKNALLFSRQWPRCDGSEFVGIVHPAGSFFVHRANGMGAQCLTG
jgi:hypothetical protein